MSAGPYREGEGTPPRRVRRRLTWTGWCGVAAPLFVIASWLVYAAAAQPDLIPSILAGVSCLSGLIMFVAWAHRLNGKDSVPFVEEREE